MPVLRVRHDYFVDSNFAGKFVIFLLPFSIAGQLQLCEQIFWFEKNTGRMPGMKKESTN